MNRNRGRGGGMRGGRQGAGLLGQAPMQHAAMDNMSTGMKRLLGTAAGGILGNAPMEGRGRMVPQQQRGLLEEPNLPTMRGGMQDEHDQWGHRDEIGYHDNQPRGLLDDPGYGMEADWQDAGDYGHPPEYHDEYNDRYSDPGGLREPPPPPARRGLIETRNVRGGVIDRAVDYGYEDRQLGHFDGPETSRALMDRARIMQGQQRRDGLLEEPRGLLDAPDMRRGLIDEPRRLMEPVDVRGGGNGLLKEPRGLFDAPDRRHNYMDDGGQGGRRGDGLLDPPDPMAWQQGGGPGWVEPGGRQQDLLEKADLQIRMLQEEKMKEEATRMIKMEEERQKRRSAMRNQRGRGKDGLLGSGPQKTAIPSIFDLFEGPRKLLGKRPASESGRGGGRLDNKRQRQGQSDRGHQARRQSRRDSRDKDNRGGRDRDRNAPRKSRFDTPKDSNAQSRTKSGSSDSKKSKPRFVKDDAKKQGNKPADSGKGTEKDKDVAKDTVAKETVAKDQTSESDVTVEVYDPAQPTDDVEMKDDDKPDTENSEITVKVEPEEEKTEKDEDGNKMKEISLTVTVNKKGRSVNDADKKTEDQAKKEKKYKCNVCNVECFDEESFFRHMNGVKHVKKMGIVMSVAPQSVARLTSRKQAEEHLRKIEGHKVMGPSGKALPTGKALETLCKTCNSKFTGAYKDHKESAEHKERENRRMAGCKLCNVATFNTFTDYAKHLKSAWHKKKAKLASWPECKICDQKFKSPRKFVQHCRTDHHIKNKQQNKDEDSDGDDIEGLVTLDTVGFEEDGISNETEPLSPTASQQMSTSTPKTSGKASTVEMDAMTPVLADSQSTGSTDNQSTPVNEPMEVPEKYDPEVAVGQKFVISVTGFFCKLCHKFYNNETSAKIAHCQSQPHFEKFKKAMMARVGEKKPKSEVEKSSVNSKTATLPSDETDTQKEPQNGSVNADDKSMVTETGSVLTDSTCYETANEESQASIAASDSTASDTLEAVEADAAIAIETEEPKTKSTPKARRGGGAARGAGKAQRARRGRKV